MPFRLSALAGGLLVSLPLVFSTSSAQEPLPWQRSEPRYQSDDAYRRNEPATRAEDLDDPDTSREPPRRRDARPSPSRPDDAYSPRYASPRPPADDAYRPPQNDRGYDGQRGNDAYSPPRPSYVERPYAVPGRTYSSERYGEPSALGAWVPIRLDEEFNVYSQTGQIAPGIGSTAAQTITGRADYSNFRKLGIDVHQIVR